MKEQPVLGGEAFIGKYLREGDISAYSVEIGRLIIHIISIRI